MLWLEQFSKLEVLVIKIQWLSFWKKIKYMDWGDNMDKLKLIPIKGNIKEQLKSQAIKRRLKIPDYIEYLVKKDKEKLDNK